MTSNNNTIKVGLALVIALMVIIYFNPPHTPCQSQTEIYSESMGALGKSYSKAFKECKNQTDQGGCLPLFEVLGKLEAKFTEVGRQCQPTLASDSVTRKWIAGSMELITFAAWGSKPPQSYLYKNGWLEQTYIVEFCRLRQHLELLYGKDSWNEFVNNMLQSLPGAKELGRNEAWNRSIISDTCQYSL